MASSALLSLEPNLDRSTAEPAHSRDDHRESALASVAVGTPVRVVALRIEEDMAAWLRAVGIAEGREVTVLRRAVFGGPLHVRTGCGGEFALHRALAASIATCASRAAQ